MKVHGTTEVDGEVFHLIVSDFARTSTPCIGCHMRGSLKSCSKINKGEVTCTKVLGGIWVLAPETLNVMCIDE